MLFIHENSHMKLTILFFGPFLLVHTAFGQVVTNPMADFLSRHSESRTSELFAGESWNGRSNSQPPGGYLLRFEAPIGANGSPVLFVAASILADQLTSSWSAYTRDTEGRYMLSADDVTFGASPKFYLLSANVDGTRGLAEIFAGKTAFSVFTYYVDKAGHLQQGNIGGISRDQDEEYSDPQFEDKEMNELLKKDKLSEIFVPSIQKILLGEYLKDPSAKWRSFNPAYGVDSQQADPTEGNAVREDRLDKAKASELLKAQS
jgi:hypothetical protein